MAELPRIVSGRAQVSGVPNITLPEVSFGGIESNIAYQQQAAYQGQVAQVLDRMSRTVFGVAGEMSQRAGLQFAAENPLTGEQLQAMSKGDMSGVKLGTPLNVFNSALRKARALEVSGHAEIEAREQLIGLLQKAEMGEIDATQLRDQMTSMMNGYGEAIAQIDPDAAFKYRATMGAVGGRVLEKVAELDGQKRLLANTVKVQRLYTNMQKEIATAATTKMPIDPVTGQEMPVDMYIDALKENFLANASTLVGTRGATEYLARMDSDINASKINAISQYLITDPRFSRDPNAILRLARGDAGSASNAYQSLLPEDQAKVQAAFMTNSANNFTLQRRNQEASESGSKRQFTSLYTMYHLADDPAQKAALREQMLRHPSLTNEMVRELTGEPSTSEVGELSVRSQLFNGTITTEDQLWAETEARGVYGKERAQIFNAFNTLYSTVNGSYVKSKFRLAANIPEGVFTLDPRSDAAIKVRNMEIELLAAQKQAADMAQPFDVKAAVDNIADRAISARESATVQGAKRQLGEYEERIGGVPITRENFAALKYRIETGQEKRISKSALGAIESLLNTIEGTP
jgi:hypothetical protein